MSRQVSTFFGALLHDTEDVMVMVMVVNEWVISNDFAHEQSNFYLVTV